jgi:hypothetical protein
MARQRKGRTEFIDRSVDGTREVGINRVSVSLAVRGDGVYKVVRH